jgi:hypothetical protein
MLEHRGYMVIATVTGPQQGDSRLPAMLERRRCTVVATITGPQQGILTFQPYWSVAAAR